MTKTYMYCWNEHSASGKLLAEAMGIKRIKHEGSRFNGRRAGYIINWGSSQLPPWLYDPLIINHPFNVRAAINKLSAFEIMLEAGVSVPAFDDRKDKALAWGKRVVCRHILNGAEGRGIEIVEPGQPLPDAPLYVQYIAKRKEFRVHVVGGQVIDVQQKVKRANIPVNPNTFYIRNTTNGFVFQRNGINCPGEALVQSLLAVNALRLDFGAVDIIWNEHQNKCYVLEVNTAPGIEGSTVNKYKEALSALCNMR